jgi:protein SCO1/2
MAGGMACWALKTVSMYPKKYLSHSWLLITACMINCSCQEKKQPLPYYNTPDFTPLFVPEGKKAADLVQHTISAFSFTDQHGSTITSQQVAGKIHVANFIFTSCSSICPVMTKHMQLLQQAFEHDTGVVLLSYSVTPWVDSVNRLKQYANNNGINSPNWHLLTGDKNQIYTLARQSYFAEEDLGFSKDSTDFLHTEHILLVDKTQRIRGIYNGTLQLDMEQLIADIRTLQKEIM